MTLNALIGILIPFLGTSLGSAFVLFITVSIVALQEQSNIPPV